MIRLKQIVMNDSETRGWEGEGRGGWGGGSGG